MAELAHIASLLKQADNIMIVTHRRPDGDTLGGAYALKGALAALGKRSFVANCDRIPPSLQILTEGRELLPIEFEPDFIVTVDIAELSLAGELAEYAQRADVCIDHHKTNGAYATENFVDSKAASASELVYRVIMELGVALDKDMATALYVGVSTDTGCFRFRNNTPETMHIAAELMACGADFTEMNKRFFETVSIERIELIKEMYNNMELFDSGRLVLSHILPHSYSEDNYDGLCGELRKIDGVVAAVLMRDLGDGEYKLSARANRGFDCAVFCGNFAGGGHEGAAGGTVKGELGACKEKLKKEMSAELRRNL